MSDSMPMKPVSKPCPSCSGWISMSTQKSRPSLARFCNSALQPRPTFIASRMPCTVSASVRSECISSPGSLPTASADVKPVKRVKPSLTQTTRYSASVMRTAFVVWLATMASRARSAVMPRAICSARARPAASR